jgi:hypothetical protein
MPAVAEQELNWKLMRRMLEEVKRAQSGIRKE